MGTSESVATPPFNLGPYRVERLLGRGGMGEVYLGFDDRLGRPVALKRIKPDARDPVSSRARFRREARTMARLSHGNIVQIYDWVEDGEDDWLVMEWIEGRPLREVLAAGPLDPAEAARIAEGIATGLATAHRAGIVHRDLKADNVMLTVHREIKVLDFGLARSFVESSSDFSSISILGHIIGTVEYMSPEQALGQALDFRSDLFSLGTLLYEMLTGRRPFSTDSTVNTLARICSFKQTVVSQLSPEVPQSLAALVDRLLEKDKARRPQGTEEVVAALDGISRELSGEMIRPAEPGLTAATAVEVPVRLEPSAPQGRAKRRWIALAAAVVVLGMAGWGLYAWLVPTPPPLSVAVPPTIATGKTGDSAAAQRIVASAVHTGLLRTLLSLRHLVVREPGAEMRAFEPKAMARVMATDEVLTSTLECAGDLCQVQLRRVRGSDGNLLWAHRFAISEDDLLALSSSVAEQARNAYPDLEPSADVGNPQVGAADYARYLDLMRRFQVREKGTSYDSLMAELDGLERSAPRFLEALILEARIARLHFAETRDAAALERALSAVRRALDLAPRDPRTLLTAFDVDLDAGRLQDAAHALAQAERLQPDEPGLLALKAALLERQGKREEARAVMRDAAAREPSGYRLSQLSDMDYRAGDIPAARRHLELAIERSPDRFDGLSRLAQLELVHGDARKAAQIYESLVARSPGEAELTNLGLSYLLLGRYEEAERRLRQVLTVSPESPVALLNLADVVLVRGRREEANALYGQVAERTLSDPNPDALLRERAQALAHLGRTGEAVDAIQRAQRLDPENPDTFYASASVFALLGDNASAVRNAQRALDGGMDRRWFSLPWFDPLLPQIEDAPGGERSPQ